MYLKEIKAYGFKSFADKINIELCPNLNGIVGPNGSGKSNIVDAVRWVLGEQSIKSLRGDNSTDIIFSGSKSRTPLNSATVCLVFDNTTRSLPIDFNEVSIKRTLYRTGENEYYINNERVRLKDITDLLIDSGGSKESFNIISQGKIDEIVLAKPNERRVIIEEAAGVLKYKKRKEEALRKLDRTNNNINRVNDIISELETNLNPLKEQAKDAKIYLEVKEKLKNVEVALITKDIENLNYEYQTTKEKIASLTDEITETSNNNITYDIDILKQKDNLKEIENEINQKQSKYVDLTRSLEQKDADYRLLLERRKYATDEDKIYDKILKLKENNLITKTKLNEEENNLKILEDEINTINTNLQKQITEYHQTKEKHENIKNILANLEKEQININYKINYLEESINNNNTLPPSIKTILNNKKIEGVHNTIGNLIKVKDEYSLAINTALLASINYLVVDNTNIAKYLIKYLKENNLGRTTFYPLEVIKPRYIPNNIVSALEQQPGFINVASSLVEYNNIYDNIIKNLLGNVIVVDNIENATNIAKYLNNAYKIVTLDSQLINVGGSLTGGSSIKTSNVIKEKHELAKLKHEQEINNNKIEEFTYNLRLTDDNLATLEEKIYNQRNNLASLDNNKKIRLENINNLNSNYQNSYRELQDLEAITTSNTNYQEKLLMDEYYQIKNEVNDIESKLEKLKANKNRIEENIQELEQTNRHSMQYISKKEKELNSLEININRIEVRLDHLLLNLSEDYNMTYEYAKENYILEIEEDIAREEVKKLKDKIRNIGNVNLGAIDEYERVNTRYEFLNKQKQDLENAEKTLLEIIKEMDEVMINKFKETFETVKEEFKNVFRELFKGGKAELILTEPDNLLETGIDIKAEPPGKKLQNISLLSGGEKTFTAISLLFAILNVRPVPFCLLDEVEAALDDANVEAFCKYLDKYRNQTQFILITHKKKTMEYIDLLYGITMQESGVSKLVSVKLEEIKK